MCLSITLFAASDSRSCSSGRSSTVPGAGRERRTNAVASARTRCLGVRPARRREEPEGGGRGAGWSSGRISGPSSRPHMSLWLASPWAWKTLGVQAAAPGRTRGGTTIGRVLDLIRLNGSDAADEGRLRPTPPPDEEGLLPALRCMSPAAWWKPHGSTRHPERRLAQGRSSQLWCGPFSTATVSQTPCCASSGSPGRGAHPVVDPSRSSNGRRRARPVRI